MQTTGPQTTGLEIPEFWHLSGMGDSQRDSRESFAIDTPIFIACQADLPESLEFPIRANHATNFLAFLGGSAKS